MLLYVVHSIQLQFKKLWQFTKFFWYLITKPKIKIYWEQYVDSRPYGIRIVFGNKMVMVLELHWHTLSERRSWSSKHDYDYYSYCFSFLLRWHDNKAYDKLRGDDYGFTPLILFHVRPPKQQMKLWYRRLKNSDYYKYAFGYKRGITKLQRIGRITLIGAIVKAYTLADTMAGNEISDRLCLSDPMNGCPEDFAETFDRRNSRDMNEYDKLPLPEFIKAYFYNVLGDKHWEEYNENPAPWDWDDFPNDEEPKPTGLLHVIKTFLFGDYTAKDSDEYWDIDEEIYNDEVTVKF